MLYDPPDVGAAPVAALSRHAPQSPTKGGYKGRPYAAAAVRMASIKPSTSAPVVREFISVNGNSIPWSWGRGFGGGKTRLDRF
jgi:hypothetical protein